MSKDPDKNRAATERTEWLSQVFSSLNQYDQDLRGLPEHATEIDPGGPAMATVMRAAAYIAQLKQYRDRIVVRRDGISLRDEDGDGDVGRAWETYTLSELRDFVTFNIVLGTVQGMIQNARIEYEPRKAI